MTTVVPAFAAVHAPLEHKYTGSKEFLRVYALLIGAAERRKNVTYKDIADIMHLPSSGHHMAQETGRMLGEISVREAECGRPMLSAVCVSSVSETPGEGFFALARQLGRLPVNAAAEHKQTFWKAERERVFQAWRR